MAITKKEWEKIDSNFSRYAEIIVEDFRSQIRPVVEMQQEQGKKIDKLDQKVDKLDQKVDKLNDDMEIVKSSLKIKVDRDEFEALEKRVIFLEKKISKV